MLALSKMHFRSGLAHMQGFNRGINKNVPEPVVLRPKITGTIIKKIQNTCIQISMK